MAWTVQVLSALLLLAAAVPKLVGTEVAVEAFETIGAGQWLRVFTGVAEVAGAIGLLLRWIAGLAALGLGLLMAGATAVNFGVVDDPGAGVTTLVLLAAFAFIAWRRLRELDPRRLLDPLGRHR
ncbi:DoxX family protein [Streptomyces sp. DSM 44917]|uniref:DoxX family protein n=1 Tax=Streptomyces boetiae TaxID=3075541 RepID=A0ABU2LBP0_9ACTN|nr:DoxX family protein [Streptomyces sp. DSM 44917]MDT0308722.1 DoxX family protein [Streptomyces sp. DSM 44917]